MKKYSNILVIILTLLFTYEFLLNKEVVFSTIGFSLNLWLNNIVPSLFPFFIVSDILISYNFINYIPNWITNLFIKLFHVKKEAVLVFFLSMISGFPSNARITRRMYDMGLLGEKEASHILAFTHFSNPLFILGTVSVFFFNNQRIGIIILLAHYVSNIIVGIIFRNNNLDIDNKVNIIDHNKPYFGNVFVNAIKSSIDTILLLCGILTCFLVISAIIINKLHCNEIMIKSILEITIGLKELSIHKFSELHLVMLSSFIISFGGLSIHMQVKSQLIGTNISIKPFVIGRIYQALISVVLAYIFYIFFC